MFDIKRVRNRKKERKKEAERKKKRNREREAVKALLRFHHPCMHACQCQGLHTYTAPHA
jgi:hypothetical protein